MQIDMKLTDSDIITAAHDLRDEQNEQLYVAPNPLKRSSKPSPLWWAATAAALVFGFVIGETHPLTPRVEGGESSGLHESVIAQPLPSKTGEAVDGSSAIIREVIHEVVHDTIYQTRIVRVPVQQVMTAKAEPAPDPLPESPGCSMLCDDIRYDLLAGN